MDWIKKIDIASLLLAIVIIWLLFFKSEPKDNSNIYKDYIKELHETQLKQLKSDSIRYASKIDSLTSKIKNLNYLRKDERNKYLQEQSKYNNLTTDSSYNHVLDSIKKVCCSDSTSR